VRELRRGFFFELRILRNAELRLFVETHRNQIHLDLIILKTLKVKLKHKLCRVAKNEIKIILHKLYEDLFEKKFKRTIEVNLSSFYYFYK